jgi:hypothetical protein
MARGQLRVYLGAAPGVGKTFAMLQEAHRRRERGTDVVVAYVETHGRPPFQAMSGELAPEHTPGGGLTMVLRLPTARHDTGIALPPLPDRPTLRRA